MIIITGASGGIGSSIALRLAKRKKSLLITGSDGTKLESVASEISKNEATEVEVVRCDFQSEPDCAALIKHISGLAKIDALINCAGTAEGSERLERMEWSDIRRMIDVNLSALIRITQAVLPSMLKNESGHILSVGSIAGISGSPLNSVYGATKSAIRMFHESLRHDLLGKGISLTLVEPGTVKNDFGSRRMKGNIARTRAMYESFAALSSDQVAEAIEWTLTRPRGVNVDELVLSSIDQAGASAVFRRPDGQNS